MLRMKGVTFHRFHVCVMAANKDEFGSIQQMYILTTTPLLYVVLGAQLGCLELSEPAPPSF